MGEKQVTVSPENHHFPQEITVGYRWSFFGYSKSPKYNPNPPTLTTGDSMGIWVNNE